MGQLVMWEILSGLALLNILRLGSTVLILDKASPLQALSRKRRQRLAEAHGAIMSMMMGRGYSCLLLHRAPGAPGDGCDFCVTAMMCLAVLNLIFQVVSWRNNICS